MQDIVQSSGGKVLSGRHKTVKIATAAYIPRRKKTRRWTPNSFIEGEIPRLQTQGAEVEQTTEQREHLIQEGDAIDPDLRIFIQNTDMIE